MSRRHIASIVAVCLVICWGADRLAAANAKLGAVKTSVLCSTTKLGDGTEYGYFEVVVSGAGVKELALQLPRAKRTMTVNNKLEFDNIRLDRSMPWKDFVKAFPEGKYNLVITRFKEPKAKSEIEISHDKLPPSPVVAAPADGAVVPSADLQVTWNAAPVGSGTTSVFVWVETTAGARRSWETYLDATATNVVIPAGFLTPGEYEIGVAFDATDGILTLGGSQIIEITVQ